jgi:hypothetical protein
MLEDGTFDVDANTSIDDLSEELSVKIPEVYFSFDLCFLITLLGTPSYSGK